MLKRIASPFRGSFATTEVIGPWGAPTVPQEEGRSKALRGRALSKDTVAFGSRDRRVPWRSVAHASSSAWLIPFTVGAFARLGTRAVAGRLRLVAEGGRCRSLPVGADTGRVLGRTLSTRHTREGNGCFSLDVDYHGIGCRNFEICQVDTSTVVSERGSRSICMHVAEEIQECSHGHRAHQAVLYARPRHKLKSQQMCFLLVFSRCGGHP